MMRLSKILCSTTLVAIAAALMACDEKPVISATGASPASAISSSAPLSDLYDKAAKKANGIQAGSMMAARTLYVFFDPRCPHCHHLYKASRPLAKDTSMIWVPVALLGPQSKVLANHLLSASDTAATLDQLMMTPAPAAPQSSLDKNTAIEANTALLTELKNGEQVSVPFVLYRNAAGSTKIPSNPGGMTTDDLRLFLQQ